MDNVDKMTDEILDNLNLACRDFLYTKQTKESGLKKDLTKESCIEFIQILECVVDRENYVVEQLNID